MPPRTDLYDTRPSAGLIRCLLVHDHVLLRQGLRRLLEDESDIDVIGEAGNAAECLRKVHELQPDIVVAGTGTLDLPVPEAKLRVARESSRTKIVFLSTQEATASHFVGFHLANDDFAVRHTSAEQLKQMVRNTCDGPQREAFVTHDGPHSMEQQAPREAALTGREREVLKLLAEGKTVRAAADILGLSAKTVDAHKFNLMRKLNIHNKAELVMWAIQRHILKVPVNF